MTSAIIGSQGGPSDPGGGGVCGSAEELGDGDTVESADEDAPAVAPSTVEPGDTPGGPAEGVVGKPAGEILAPG